ncbi:hypothetical protein HYS50_01475 [Candidatus Woesearchaeota archaeon]|nr:hypothetical protein [Candidatus Woesearchaeota archaeon]
MLAKISRLELLKRMYQTIYIPREVFNEVIIKGKEEQYSDAFFIEKQINDSIHVKELKTAWKIEAEKLKKILGSGESEAIALALQEKAKLLLMDNIEPKRIAELKNIKCRSTPGILLEALKKRIIKPREYIEDIKKLASFAWLSADVVAYFLEEGFKHRKGENHENK